MSSFYGEQYRRGKKKREGVGGGVLRKKPRKIIFIRLQRKKVLKEEGDLKAITLVFHTSNDYQGG